MRPLAMEQLITDKAIILSKDQKSEIMPIIQELSSPGLAADQMAALKMRFRNVLEPSQLQKMQEWQATAAEKARGLWAIPPGLSTLIATYTGISTEMVQEKIAALQAWWQTVRPVNSAEKLRGTIGAI